MKIWLDDISTAPSGYVHIRSISELKALIENAELEGLDVELIDCSNDLCHFERVSSDGVELLDWLHNRGKLYNIELHKCNGKRYRRGE